MTAPAATTGRWPVVAPVLVAGAAWLGAAASVSVALWPVVAGAGLGLAAVGRRNRAVVVTGLCLSVGVACGGLGQSAWDGLDAAVPPVIAGEVTVVKDPRPVTRGVRVEVVHDGRRYDAFARGSAAGTISRLRAGERVWIEATVRPRDADDRWRASRHVAGLAEVSAARSPRGASGVWAMANAVHRTLASGASELTPAQRGVLLGVSVGDRGGIPDEVGADLRAAGLAHLTAVSGQHVAMLLVVASPALRRLSGPWRLAAVAVLLVGFVFVTRAEPSVLRAVGMALVVELARAGGRHLRGVRVLAVVVTVMVVADPLVVWSVGFQLSVAATAGIAVGAARVAAALPGPRAVAGLVAMGVCAQLAVAPLAVTYFGRVPVTGVLAGVVASPVVGVVLGWGLTAGVVGGALGLGPWVHAPTGLATSWVVAVAGWFAALPVGQLAAGHVVALLVAAGVAWWAARHAHVAVRRVAVGAAVVVVAAALVAPVPPPAGRYAAGAGAEVVVGTAGVVVTVDGRAATGVVLDVLRRHGVTSVVAVVAPTGAAAAVAAGEAVCARRGPCPTLVPAGVAAASGGTQEVVRPVDIDLGGWTVSVAPGSDRLAVTVSAAGSGPGDGPV